MENVYDTDADKREALRSTEAAAKLCFEEFVKVREIEPNYIAHTLETPGMKLYAFTEAQIINILQVSYGRGVTVGMRTIVEMLHERHEQQRREATALSTT